VVELGSVVEVGRDLISFKRKTGQCSVAQEICIKIFKQINRIKKEITALFWV
jgi:hypothetical protein